jgi:hypothetical protein
VRGPRTQRRRRLDGPTGRGPTGGRPLDQPTRRFFETRLDYDFSSVRVHTDAQANAAARALGARAFTHGSDVVFDAGEYSPATSEGRRLLAHELAHVVQQDASGAAPATELAEADGMLEREASGAAAAVTAGAPAPPLSRAPAGLLQAQFGELRVGEARMAAEAALPTPFPSGGMKVIGPDAAALVAMLTTCTGLPLRLAADGTVERLAGPPAIGPGVSPAAQATLEAILADTTAGILVNTTPKTMGVVGGAFSHATPGYQFIDVPDVRIMGAPTGVPGGATVCDLVLHELAEAHAARVASLTKGTMGAAAFTAGHAAGVKAEEAIRAETKLPLRGAGAGDFQELFSTPAPAGEQHRYFLETTEFGTGKGLRTQVTLLLVVIKLDAAGNPTGATTDVVASHVVAGAVHFKTQRQAIETFNKYAASFGFKPVPIPKGLK